MRSVWIATLCLALSTPLFSSGSAAAGNSADGPAFTVLVFSKTEGYRHDSIPYGIAAIAELGAEYNFAVEATEEAAEFTDERLARYAAVIFLNTIGPILDDDQKAAFQRYIQSGGGFVGIHSASDTEHDWAWYGQLVGTYVRDHSAIVPASIHVIDRDHPSTASLPELWTRTDEWYNFEANPRGTVHILALLDESTYEGGDMGADHPISWCHDFDGGRSWYTAMGHTEESYGEPLFRWHILGGILTAAGAADADCRTTF